MKHCTLSTLSDSAFTRRHMFKLLGSVAVAPLLPSSMGGAATTALPHEDEAFLEDMERRGCLFFWEQASPKTGQVLDRARNDLAPGNAKGPRDPRRMASIDNQRQFRLGY